MSYNRSVMEGKRFRRMRKGKKILGLCGGLARYWGHDPTYIRFLWLTLTLLFIGFSPGIGLLWILLYFLSAVLVPYEDESPA